MSGNKAAELQCQVRQNAEELQDFLKDLVNWENEMKITDEEIRKKGSKDVQDLPPVRTFVKSEQKPTKNKKKKLAKPKPSEKKMHKEEESEKKRIAGYDYRAWDKFDVDGALKEIDENEKERASAEDCSDDSETEFIECGKKKQQALLEKDKGNIYFKNGSYDMAISCYTSGILLDPTNPLLLANRAMALLRKGQLAAAESDCDSCLKLEPTYIKAYHRRGIARLGLHKYDDARGDFLKVLQFDPGNKEAKLELENIAKALDSSKSDGPAAAKAKMCSDTQNFENSAVQNVDDSSIIKPIYKPPHLRSKKPMKEISIKNVRNIFQDSVSSVTEEAHMSPTNTTKKEGILNSWGDDDEINSLETTKEKDETRAMEVINYSSSENIKPLPITSLPAIPSTSFQFLTDWKKMKYHPDLQYQYLKNFPPEKLPVIFKQSMDTDLFTGILQVLSTQFVENGDDVYPFLRHLSCVGRFQTLVMFLSEQEISELKTLFEYTKRMQKHAEDGVDNLWNCYIPK